MGKIRFKIIATVLFCSISLALSLTWINAGYSNRLLKQEAEEKLTNLVSSYGIALDSEFAKKELVAQSLNSMIVSTIDTEKLYSDSDYLDTYEEMILPFFQEMSHSFKDVWVFFNPSIDKEGHDIWFFDENQDGITERIEEQDFDFYEDKTGKEWFFTPKETREAYWTKPYKELDIIPDTGISWITYSLPIYIEDKFIAVVGTDFVFQDLEDDLKELSIYGSGYAVLLNDQFEYLIHPEFETENLATMDNGTYAWIADKMRDEPQGIFEYTWVDDKEKILAYTTLENGWILLMTAEKRAIFTTLLQQLSLMVVFIIIGTALAIALSIFLGSNISKPLEGLTLKIEEIGSGNYDVEIPQMYIDQSNEIGILAQAVEEMRAHNKQSIEQIKHYNLNLEKLVDERTLELKESHEIILETKKAHAVSNLVMEIAHRLNTPIGNSMTTLSHIESTLKNIIITAEKNGENINFDDCIAKMKNMDDALHIVMNSMSASSEIVKTLQKFSTVTSNLQLNSLNLCEYLEGITAYIVTMQANHGNVKFNINFTGEIILNTYSKLIVEVLNYITEYSLLYSTSGLDQCIIDITIVEHEKYVEIDYEDNGNLLYDTIADRVFDPFAFASFNVGSSGLQMHMVYYMITRGLRGHIKCLRSERDTPRFRIRLPKTIAH